MARNRKPEPPSAFNLMWCIVMFDLPVRTRREVREATRYRNGLLELGFIMKQYSVYMRHCRDREHAERLADIAGADVPPGGSVSVLFITDRQYLMTRNYFGPNLRENEAKRRKETGQLTLF